MSLLAKRTGLIFLSALIIFSCKEKEKVGLELESDHKVGTFYTDTITIQSFANLKNDSIATHNQSYLYAGAFEDNIFGNTVAEAYTQLLLGAEGKDATYTVIDSVVLVLGYDFHYGDTTQSQTLNVSKIESTETLDNSTTYFSVHPALQKVPGIVDQDIAFQARPSTQTQRIRLTNTFGIELMGLLGGALGTTNAAFTSAFKGIALVPKSPVQGALLRIKLYDNSSKVVIYHDNNKTQELLLNTSSARFSRITSDRSTTADLATLVNSGDETNVMGKAYIQSGLGVRTKIKFPYLSDFKNKHGNIAINRAELIVETNPSIIDPLSPVGLLQLVKLNNAGNVRQYNNGSSWVNQVVQVDLYDVNGTGAPLSVFYNSATNSYIFNISTYFNALLQGVEENNGLIIAPHPVVSNTSVNRTFAEEANVKLKVYYTKVD